MSSIDQQAKGKKDGEIRYFNSLDAWKIEASF